MNAYWSQWSYEEIMSNHGIEEDESDICYEDIETESYQQYGCCSGVGCNYCLMIS